MSNTKTSTAMICYPEVTSLKDHIFGGYILREAHDIAWTNTAQFTFVKIK